MDNIADLVCFLCNCDVIMVISTTVTIMVTASRSWYGWQM